MLLAFIVGFLEKAYKNFFSKNFTLIRVGFLGVLFVEEGLGGRGKSSPSLKHARVMLETWNQFQKIYLSTNTHLILLMSVIFLKNQHFWQKQYLYSKQQHESCVSEFLVLLLVFVRYKITVELGYCCWSRFNANITTGSGVMTIFGTGLEPRTTQFLKEHSTIWPNRPND